MTLISGFSPFLSIFFSNTNNKNHKNPTSSSDNGSSWVWIMGRVAPMDMVIGWGRLGGHHKGFCYGLGVCDEPKIIYD
jgi:hypothetical protein